MSLQQLFTSRKPYDATTFVGQEGKIFYDVDAGLFRLGDGTTPGGKIVGNLAIAAYGTTPPNNPYPGELWYNPSSKELWTYYNGSFRGTINPATTSTLGGIIAGPGVVIANDGTLSLDSTGIPFNFGDFYAFTNPGPSDGACLSSINANQDVNLVSNGSGSINLVGVFNIHTTNEDVEGALVKPPIFSVDSNGLTMIRTPALTTGTSVLSVSANTSTTVIPLVAGALGAVLQLTGANNNSTTVAIDNFSNLAASSSNFTFRRYRGTVDAPLAVQADDLVAAIGSTAFDGTSTAMLPGQVTSIRFVAAENQTPTNKGSRIDMYAIPLSTSSRTLNLSLTGSQVLVPLTANSTSTTTGALVVSGGVGIAKDVHVVGTVKAGLFDGLNKRAVRDLGTIADGGTATIDFSTDDIVLFAWGNGVNLAYQNYTAGRLVKVLARKTSGSGTDSLNLDGLTAANVSSGSTTFAGSQDQTYFIELICTNTSIGGVYAKV